MKRPPPQPSPAADRALALGGRSGHNPVLDGVRGVAILLVMLHHFTCMTINAPWEDWLHLLLAHGTTGVTLFFVLSGFLITGILYDSRDSPRYFINFYARRTLRIFPLYYAVVFASIILIPVILPAIAQSVASPQVADLIRSKVDRFGSIAGYEWSFWLYVCNFAQAWVGKFMHGILGVCWSLAIEEQFYLIWPLIVFLCRGRRLVHACIAIIVGAFLLRVGMIITFHASGTTIAEPLPLANPLGIYVLTPCRVDGLAFGALLAVAARGGWASVDLRRWIKPAKLLVILGVPITIAIPLIEKAAGIGYPELGGMGPIDQSLGYSLQAAVYAAVILLALHARPGSGWSWVWTNRLMLALGKYSYALYLFHLPIRAVLRDMVFGPAMVGPNAGNARIKFFTVMGSELPGQIVFMVIAGALSLLAAWISWHVYEKHWLKLKRFFPSAGDGPRGGGTPRTDPPAPPTPTRPTA